MPKHGFWAPEAQEYLVQMGRQDLVDKGDALGQRVTALLLTAKNRLNSYAENGNLYENMGGISTMEENDSLAKLEEFVNIRLRAEIDALENLLDVFDSIEKSPTVHTNTFRVSLL